MMKSWGAGERTQRLVDSFINLTSDGIVVVDPTGRVLEVNHKFEELHGWTREELIGQILPMIPEEFKANAHQIYQRITEGEQLTNLELIKLRKDGSTFYADVSISPMRDENGTIVAFVILERDITERKKTEDALKESEERYRVLVEESPEGIVVYRDLKIVFANPAAAKLVGIQDPQALIGQFVFNYVHPEHLQALIQLDKTLKDNDKPSEAWEKKLVGINGQIIDVLVKAVPIKFQNQMSVQLLFRDITEQKKVEVQLEERELQYRRLLKLSPVPIILHRKDIIQFVNDIGIKSLGGSGIQDFIGRSIYDFIAPYNHAQMSDRINSVVRSDDYLDFIEFKLLRVDGTLFDAEVSSVYVHQQMGSPTIQTVIHDLTERKKTEEMVLKSEKLSIIGQLAAGIAHEIRNPLTSLKGFTKLLKTPENQKHFIQIMTDELEKIEQIVNEFMSMAKPHKSNFKKTKLPTLVENVVRFMEPQAHLCAVQIQCDMDYKMKNVTCDQIKIKQVLMNVLKNAIESMPNGGIVQIQVINLEDEQAMIRIKDQGNGITEDQLLKIGEPFFTMKEHGTGLGLMICHSIVEEHKGKLTIESQLNQGTTVEIILPI
ncbi:PAS domain S-box protein [Paenibacillus psychroresistens]|uniref:histidine kinase n=1 Tax=Paenibacillus psychroresistens TaxID=1778678 RepID=A0A6B8RPN2_9BACL|nr:PAS domain S-box protein [Paenibacillus psychroresistens]QGQ98331.1 PAS domain S-box protein [Paenibacillus psychroresistens]